MPRLLMYGRYEISIEWGGLIRNSEGECIGDMKSNGPICDRRGNVIGQVSGGTILDASGNLMAYISKGKLYDHVGQVLGEINVERKGCFLGLIEGGGNSDFCGGPWGRISGGGSMGAHLRTRTTRTGRCPGFLLNAQNLFFR